LDFKRNRITIRQTKAGEARHILMNDVVLQILQSPPGCSIILSFFPARKGAFERVSRTLNGKDIQEAGIENFRWHDLRHTFATRLVMKGVSLYVENAVDLASDTRTDTSSQRFRPFSTKPFILNQRLGGENGRRNGLKNRLRPALDGRFRGLSTI